MLVVKVKSCWNKKYQVQTHEKLLKYSNKVILLRYFASLYFIFASLLKPTMCCCVSSISLLGLQPAGAVQRQYPA